jgi:hypothetical protein
MFQDKPVEPWQQLNCPINNPDRRTFLNDKNYFLVDGKAISIVSFQFKGIGTCRSDHEPSSPHTIEVVNEREPWPGGERAGITDYRRFSLKVR